MSFRASLPEKHMVCHDSWAAIMLPEFWSPQGKRMMEEICCRCLEALQLPATLQTIQRYFFMGAGDWADALVAAYCAVGPSLEPQSLHACHSMLGTALQVGRCARFPPCSCCMRSEGCQVCNLRPDRSSMLAVTPRVPLS